MCLDFHPLDAVKPMFCSSYDAHCWKQIKKNVLTVHVFAFDDQEFCHTEFILGNIKIDLHFAIILNTEMGAMTIGHIGEILPPWTEE